MRSVGVNKEYTKEELADLAEWQAKGTNPLQQRKRINPARERAKQLEQAAYLSRHNEALKNTEPGSFGAMMARRKHGVMKKALRVQRKISAHEEKERAKIAAMIAGVGLDPKLLMRK